MINNFESFLHENESLEKLKDHLAKLYDMFSHEDLVISSDSTGLGLFRKGMFGLTRLAFILDPEECNPEIEAELKKTLSKLILYNKFKV